MKQRDFAPTQRTKLKRLPKRGNFQRETIYQILDEAFVCHVGFTIDGQPFVIPTSFARIDNRLLIHGSSVSRMLKNLSGGVEACITVTLLDGLILARSAFHHSMNYRSVVMFGIAALVEDETEKYEALHAFTEKILPGRWAEVRPPNRNELKATSVLPFPIEEASAKVRIGAPVDDEDDYRMNVWAGEIPLRVKCETPIPDARLAADTILPDYISSYFSKG